MAQIPVRLNLTSKGFPLLSEKQGRTVIIPGQDLTGNPYSPAREEVDGSIAMPEIYYGHNIIPTAQGYQSAAYRTLSLPPAGTANDFSSTLVLRDSAGNKAYLAPTTGGRNYILKTYLGGWIRIADILPTGNGLVTTAYVNGLTYIWFEGVGCYTYNFTSDTLVPVILAGLTPANIRGITTAAGFLVAFGPTYLYWSSSIDPTDFIPSLTTGAGGGNVQDLKGTITTVIPHKLGFMIYSTYNIIIGFYTANIRFPFSYKEVQGSGGLAQQRYVDIDPVSGDHYAWTTSGLQLVTAQVTNGVFPEITDFLAGLYYEDFNETTVTFTQQFLAAPMVKKITTVADRYLILSYGPTSLTYALIYDTVLKRMGKLKINHVDCFEYLLLNTNAVDTPKNSVGFLQADGTVVIASFSADNIYAEGVMLLGKFQFARPVTAELYQICLENVRQDYAFTCRDLYSIDGKTTAGIATGYLQAASGLFRDYRFRASGLNHSLLFTGAFDMVSIVAYFSMNGYR